MTPRRSRDLLRVLRRAYAGKSERASAPDPDGRAPETIASTLRDLGRLVTSGPVPALDAATYAAFAAGARLAVPFGSVAGAGGSATTAPGRAEMAGAIPRTGETLELGRETLARSHAVPLLQLFALTLMVIPSDTVIKAIGADGYPAALIGMFAFAAIVAATLLGLHNPLRHRHPVRGAVCLLWLAALALLRADGPQRADGGGGGGRGPLLMQLAMVTGVALVAAECLSSLEDVRRVLRALCWGGAFCGVVAALQFWISLDIAAVPARAAWVLAQLREPGDPRPVRR